MHTPPPAPAAAVPFFVALRALYSDRLAGRLDPELYCWRRAELHYRHQRPGYTWEDACRDVAEYRRRRELADGLRARAREILGGIA